MEFPRNIIFFHLRTLKYNQVFIDLIDQYKHKNYTWIQLDIHTILLHKTTIPLVISATVYI